MVIKTPITLPLNRKGMRSQSDVIYDYEVELDQEGNPVLDEQGNEKKKPIYYLIRKRGTDEIYDVADDVLEYEYDEITKEEMDARFHKIEA